MSNNAIILKLKVLCSQGRSQDCSKRGRSHCVRVRILNILSCRKRKRMIKRLLNACLAWYKQAKRNLNVVLISAPVRTILEAYQHASHTRWDDLITSILHLGGASNLVAHLRRYFMSQSMSLAKKYTSGLTVVKRNQACKQLDRLFLMKFNPTRTVFLWVVSQCFYLEKL